MIYHREEEGLEFLSPSNLLNQLPDFMKELWNGDEWKTTMGFTPISLISTILSTLYFSYKDL